VRRNVLYGGRVEGDIDLGLEPSRLDSAGNKAWARIDAPGGRLPGKDDQSVYEACATQKYRIGSRRVVDNKVYRYTQLASTTRTGAYGGVTGGLGLFSIATNSGALTIVTAALGALTVTISSPTLVVNAYAGGLLTIYEAGQPLAILGIVSNTATVIYLDGPLPGTYTAGVNANSQVIAGPYASVVIAGVSVSAGAAFDYCPGIFNSPLDEDGNVAAADDYLWLQTWGLCNMWASGSYQGGAGGERVVVVQGDGCAQVNTALANTAHLGFQRIGHLYPGSGDVAVGNNPDPADGTDVGLMNHIIMLEIAP